MTRRLTWHRPRRRPSPEAVAVTAILVLGAILYAMSVAARPAAPHSITDIAPRCADARQPCKGGLS